MQDPTGASAVVTMDWTPCWDGRRPAGSMGGQCTGLPGRQCKCSQSNGVSHAQAEARGSGFLQVLDLSTLAGQGVTDGQ